MIAQTSGVAVPTAVDREPQDGVNKVLVIGADKVGKHYILQRLLNRPDLPVVPVSLGLSSSGLDAVTVDTVAWCVETRYYAAALTFHVLRDSAVPVFSPSSLSGLLASPLLSSVSSVVLVYDAGRVESLRAVQRWSAVTAQLDDEDRIMLCVGAEQAAGDGSEALWDEARDWCIDHAIEHVRLRYEDDAARGRLRLSGGGARRQDDEDEEGIERLESALHANHWPHMALKDRQAVAHSRLGRLGRLSDEAGADQPLSIDARLAQDEEREEAELEAHLQAEAEDEARQAADRQRLRAELEAEGVKLDDDDAEHAATDEEATDEEKQTNRASHNPPLCAADATIADLQQQRAELRRQLAAAQAAAIVQPPPARAGSSTAPRRAEDHLDRGERTFAAYVHEHLHLKPGSWVSIVDDNPATLTVFDTYQQAGEAHRSHELWFAAQFWGRPTRYEMAAPTVSCPSARDDDDDDDGDEREDIGGHFLFSYVDAEISDPSRIDRPLPQLRRLMVDSGAATCMGPAKHLRLYRPVRRSVVCGVGGAVGITHVDAKIALRDTPRVRAVFPARPAPVVVPIGYPDTPQAGDQWILGQSFLTLFTHIWVANVWVDNAAVHMVGSD